MAARGPIPEASPVEGTGPQRTSVRKSMLDLEVEHSFKDGEISVWMDGKLAYTHPLQTEGKKHLLSFHKARGRLSQKLFVSAGEHRVEVRAQSDSAGYDERKQVSCNLQAGSAKRLRISFDGPGEGLHLALK